MFIVLEGVDGVGKTTICNQLKNIMTEAVFTSDPRGTDSGKILITMVTGDAEKDLSLFTEARKYLVEEIITPSLTAGKNVVCDRYIPSTYAYQGSMGISDGKIAHINSEFPEPDIIFLLDCPLSVSKNRIGKMDLIESKYLGEKVRKKYLTIGKYFKNFIILNAEDSIEHNSNIILSYIF